MKLNQNISLPFLNRTNPQELLFFTKHLSVMTKAGIPIVEALETLHEQIKSETFKAVVAGVSEEVKNGKSLAIAFGKHPKVFNAFYISLVEIAEEAGTLDESLEFLSVQLAKSYSLRKKIQSALMYPAIVLLATVGMGGFISLYVLPQLVEFFQSFQIDLPPTTKVLLMFSLLMKNYGILLFAVAIVLFFCFLALTRTKAVKPHWHSLMLKWPLVGKLIFYGQLSRLCRNFGTLIKSGVPVARSLEITANTLSNIKLKNDLLSVSESLTKGKNIGESMRDKKSYSFPPLVSRMVSIGEKTGKLDETLLYLADFYEEEVDDISKNLSTILEPILLITIGLVVGFVALSIISPIYQLTGSIRS